MQQTMKDSRAHAEREPFDPRDDSCSIHRSVCQKHVDIDVNFYGLLLLTPAVCLESSLMLLFNDNFVTLHRCQIRRSWLFLKPCTALALHHEDVNTINLKRK